MLQKSVTEKQERIADLGTSKSGFFGRGQVLSARSLSRFVLLTQHLPPLSCPAFGGRIFIRSEIKINLNGVQGFTRAFTLKARRSLVLVTNLFSLLLSWRPGSADLVSPAFDRFWEISQCREDSKSRPWQLRKSVCNWLKKKKKKDDVCQALASVLLKQQLPIFLCEGGTE